MTRKQIGAVLAGVVLAVAAALLILVFLHSRGEPTQAQPAACTAPDNGSGTVDLPPLACEYVAPDEPMMIIDGLPPGTTIELDPILMGFVCSNPLICSMTLAPGECETAGGSLGGDGCCADAALDLTVTGTGDLAGFNRHFVVPVGLEAHSGPRTPGDPVQTFPRVMYRLQGELFGDPDFCEFIVTAGTDFGLPSPGQTTLTELPSGDYAVDSFFDITYQIEFEGCLGSQLEGLAGTTTETVRLETGDGGPYDLLKWQQLPDLAPTGLDVTAQIPGVGVTLADDFECDQNGPITQIDFWGSWWHDTLPYGDPQQVGFILSLHSDVPSPPADYSHPGSLLWWHAFAPGECVAELYAEDLEEGWFDPPDSYEPYADTVVWLYRCPVPEEYWFYQEEGTIYWLDVSAYPEEESYFGWKTSLYHWNDDGAYAFGEEPDIDPSAWFELLYPDGEPPHPMVGESIDLAFRIWGREAVVVETEKWQQLPDLDPTGMDVSAYYTSEGDSFVLADDYQCTTPGPITEIHVWGSWFDDILPSGGADDVSFTLSIHEDVPAVGEDPSHPGALLWQGSPSFAVKPPQGGLEEDWFEPPDSYTPDADTVVWEYVFNVDPAQYCTAPDDGSGTVELPADCDYIAPAGPMKIIDGLPPGTTIELVPTLEDFDCTNPRDFCTIALASGVCEGAGGSFSGGTASCAAASLDLVVTGTGSLAGFNRHFAVPMEAEFHWDDRTPGDPVQSFDADVYHLAGELFGDPDFCTFRVTAGRANGLPGPGQTTLSEKLAGDYAVDSFFDITYQIEFEGCPASQLEDYAGTTTGMATLRYGPAGFVQEGTLADPIIYWLDVQADTGGEAAFFGWKTSLDHAHDDAVWAIGEEPLGPLCVGPDNGTGTCNVPVADCEYIAPDEPLEIIDGLPGGTTIELDPGLDVFNCTSPNPLCSISPVPQCESAGGSLGGNASCVDGALDLDVTGTGSLAGFNRHLNVPVFSEFHWAPRTPGDPVQTFNAVIYRFFGELFGDPDFCEFRITAGSDYGLPSPGQTTLTELPSGDYAVDSFFDITYQIEFEGCPDSQLADYTGTTTGTSRIYLDVFEWSELLYPSGHPMVDESIDLAFEIWGREVPVEEEEPAKWQQSPDVNPTGIDVRANDPDFVLADDFQCEQTGPITEIVVWGSWLDDDLPEEGADDVSFTLSLHEDVPAVGEEPSHPGALLWQGSPPFTVDLYQGGLNEGWLAPPDSYTPSADTIAWEYTFYLDPAQYCTAPDDGSGTVELPADCDYVAPDEPLKIIDGLPPGTTIELDPTFDTFDCSGARTFCTVSPPLSSGVCEGDGGLLGGTASCADATLGLAVTGTGELEGFNRSLSVAVESEFHWDDRNPGDPVQTFTADMYHLEGEIFGDPDFCTFRITAGTANGMASPGQTTLTQLASGDFAVDSFFDISYEIEFEGCPASQLEDYAGTTSETATIQYRFVPADFLQEGTEDAPITYWLDVQADSDEGLFGWKTSLDHWNDDAAWVPGPEPAGPLCHAPDNGTGTSDLPVADCEYIAPDEPLEIIDGLPPGTTIELDPALDVFDCDEPNLLCSISPAPQCEGAGGSLGGTGSCVDGELDLVVTGTGSLAGFSRHINVPVFGEFHWAPRTPGDPVQTFNAVIYRFFGELFGDPDFCEFRITAGSDYGLPGPGQTTLTEQLAGDYAVDSFFDITYQIEFAGCPDSQLADYEGTTTGTSRIYLDASEWSELLYPSGHPWAGQSIDLAFALRGEVDTDGDGLLDPDDPDDDNDSKGLGLLGGFFRDTIELFVGTDPLDDCADTSTANDETGVGESPWPPDFNDSGKVTSADAVAFRQNYEPLTGVYNARYDLNASTKVTSADVVLFKNYFVGTGYDTCAVG